MNIGMSPHMIERPLFRLEVFEIGQFVKVCAQMILARSAKGPRSLQAVVKTSPTRPLLSSTSSRIEGAIQ
jgi:hypothetical protein